MEAILLVLSPAKKYVGDFDTILVKYVHCKYHSVLHEQKKVICQTTETNTFGTTSVIKKFLRFCKSIIKISRKIQRLIGLFVKFKIEDNQRIKNLKALCVLYMLECM